VDGLHPLMSANAHLSGKNHAQMPMREIGKGSRILLNPAN
jgi:hypothetical protein